MDLSIVDIIGYSAMGVLMISFMIGDLRKLRIVNTVGCVLFVIWGILISEPPIIITNVFITGVNIYYLFIKKN